MKTRIQIAKDLVWQAIAALDSKWDPGGACENDDALVDATLRHALKEIDEALKED